MGNRKAFVAISTTTLTAIGTIVACGNDQAKPDSGVTVHDSPIDHGIVIDGPPDAPSFDFSCAGNSPPPPNTNVTIAGSANEVGYNGSVTFLPLAGAAVDLCKGNCNGPSRLGSDTTDGSGGYSIGPIATNGSAVDAYVRLTNAGDRTILSYPASPYAADMIQPVITFQDLIIQFGGQFGCSQMDQNGMVGVIVADCSNHPINDSANVHISVQQGGSDVGDAQIDAGALNAMASGFFLVCNVPPGATTTIGATYNGMTMRAHDVQVTAGTTTETLVRPGF